MNAAAFITIATIGAAAFLAAKHSSTHKNNQTMKKKTTKPAKKTTAYPKRVTKRRVKTMKNIPGVKANGQLRKGFRYAKGGRVVKAKSKK